MEASVAEQKFIQRWESRDEARERVLTENAELIAMALEAESWGMLQSHTMAHLRAFPTLIMHMAADPEGKTMTSSTKRERDGLLKAFPELKVEPLIHRYALIDDVEKMQQTVYPTMVYTTPVLISGIPKIGRAVLLGYRLKYGNGGGEDESVLVTKREVGTVAPAEFVGQYYKVQNEVSHLVRKIQIWGEADSPEIPQQSWTTWDQIFLEPRAAAAVRDDLFFFINNEKAFREADIPYKRGYLIHGPPGNGKTTICRAIATSMPFASFGFDFSNSD